MGGGGMAGITPNNPCLQDHPQTVSKITLIAEVKSLLSQHPISRRIKAFRTVGVRTWTRCEVSSLYRLTMGIFGSSHVSQEPSKTG
ncbi:hypothetical protein J6590_027726 [Homalodisca vitripennis]|nr:hypothetical protein J6590_027726 [Homalodisca vitripennis]